MVDLEIQLPEGFLEEEIIDGVKVEKKTKEIWAVELDLYFQLRRVCEKYGLKYFADGGTLLGAVRHKGFIPWDDDMDFAMKRDDYEKLCEVAPKEFKYPYFFQTEFTDPGSQRGHAQLRNSRTTAVIMYEAEDYFPFNQGIFIDIFILDNLPDDPEERKKFVRHMEKTKLRFKKYARRSTRYKPLKGIKGLLKKAVHQVLGSTRNPVYEKFDREAQKYRYQETEECGMVTLKPLVREYRYRNEWIRETAELPFMFTTVPVPADYRSFLNREYGSGWETPVRASSLHGDTIFDTDRPYTEYIKNKGLRQAG